MERPFGPRRATALLPLLLFLVGGVARAGEPCAGAAIDLGAAARDPRCTVRPMLSELTDAELAIALRIEPAVVAAGKPVELQLTFVNRTALDLALVFGPGRATVLILNEKGKPASPAKGLAQTEVCRSTPAELVAGFWMVTLGPHGKATLRIAERAVHHTWSERCGALGPTELGPLAPGLYLVRVLTTLTSEHTFVAEGTLKVVK